MKGILVYQPPGRASQVAAFIEDPDIRHRGGAVVMDGEGKRHVAGNRK